LAPIAQSKLMVAIRGRFLLEISAFLLVLAHGTAGPCRGGSWADERVVWPFVCRADFSLTGWEGLFDDLARLQNDLVRCLGVPAADGPIELYLFRDEESYRRFLGQHFPDVPYRRALYILREGNAMVLAYCSRELPVDLRHECTHALLHATLPLVPLWLDEGLAEYFEVAPSQRAFGSPHLSGVRWSARLGIFSRLDSLEKKADLEEMEGREYRNAWAWAHFMIHGPSEARDELVRFLADIRAQTPPGLLSRRLEQRLPHLESRFAAHFRSWKR
jgi:hypothetical protein